MTTKFGELISKLETVQKASGCDGDGDKPADDKIQAAADDKDNKDKDKDKDGETVGKSFQVTLPDGSKADAYDGTEMLKALHTDQQALRTTVEGRDDEIMKAFEIVVGALEGQKETIEKQAKQIADQDAVIKALQTKVDAFGNTGTGRRTVVTIAEKLTPGINGTGANGGAPTAQQIMMKAQEMVLKGELAARDAARIEAFQNRGLVCPDDLIGRFQ